MARKSFVLLVMGTVTLLLSSTSSADVPSVINYQGKLTTAAGGCLNDTVQMTFSIYPDTTGSPAEWTETQNSVIVKEGIFNVLLGSVNPIPDVVFDGSVKYLGVQVESDPEMTPLKPMVSVPYAYRAGAGGGWVDDGAVVRLEDSTDYVGIGTSTPGNKLHVVGSESVPILNVEQNGSFRAVRVYSQNACALWVANAGNHGLRVTNAGGDGIHIEQAGNNGIRVKNAGGFAGYFEGSGYFRDSVGIGTTSPTEKLDVAGTAQMTGFKMPTGASNGYVLTSDASGVGTWQSAPVGDGNWTVTDSVLYTNDYWGIARGGAGNVLYGDSVSTMINLGVACTTGVNGSTKYYLTVSGGYGNSASDNYSSVGGGYRNAASGYCCAVGGGKGNIASGEYYNTVAGGQNNLADGDACAIGGGYFNSASNDRSTVSGGKRNTASGEESTVGGGSWNTASGYRSTVTGGYNNTASALCSHAEGCGSKASGDYSFAAGSGAHAAHEGAFVWADASGGELESTESNQFVIRASGGTKVYSDAGQSAGVTIHAGASAWATNSDRNLKENFTPVDGQELLEKIAALPITEWNYKTQSENIKHIGPVAQDFHAIFGLGDDDVTISTIDPAGIALAGVKELAQQNEQLRQIIDELRERIAELERAK